MQAGNVGGEDRKDDQKYPETDKSALTVCDVSGDDFKKTWLTLKELHDRELHRLQAKLTSLRKERLAVRRRRGSIVKIKELMEQQKGLNDTIQALQHRLQSRKCERCAANETYRSTLEHEYSAMKQENLKFIAELTAERDKLREENKMLSEKLKLSQQKFSPFSSSDDDFIPCAQGTASVFMVKDPEEGKEGNEGNDVYRPMKFLEQLLGPEEIKSEEENEGQQTPQLPPIFHSRDLIDMAETSYETLASDTTSKPSDLPEDSDYQKSPVFPSVSTYNFQRGHEFKTISNLSEVKLSQAKEKEMFTDKTSIQKTPAHVHFPCNISSIAEEQSPEIQVVPETSEEDMPEEPNKSGPLALKREKGCTNIFPFDYTNRKRSIGIPRYNIGGSERGGSCQIASCEQATQQKNTNESTGAAQPQGSNQSSTSGSKIKRKTRMQSEKRK